MTKTTITGLDFINDFIDYPDLGLLWLDKELDPLIEFDILNLIRANPPKTFNLDADTPYDMLCCDITDDNNEYASWLYSEVYDMVTNLFDELNPWYEDNSFEDDFPDLELVDCDPYEDYWNFTREEADNYTPNFIERINLDKLRSVLKNEA